MDTFCRVAIGRLCVPTPAYMRGSARPSSAVALTTEASGTRYLMLNEIAQCSSCKILLLACSEVIVFGGIGAADTIKYTLTDAARDLIVLDLTKEKVIKANFLYIIPSTKPEWCHSSYSGMQISYVFSRTNEFERD